MNGVWFDVGLLTVRSFPRVQYIDDFIFGQSPLTGSFFISWSLFAQLSSREWIFMCGTFAHVITGVCKTCDHVTAPSVDEDHEEQLKAPEKPNKRSLSKA